MGGLCVGARVMCSMLVLGFSVRKCVLSSGIKVFFFFFLISFCLG